MDNKGTYLAIGGALLALVSLKKDINNILHQIVGFFPVDSIYDILTILGIIVLMISFYLYFFGYIKPKLDKCKVTDLTYETRILKLHEIQWATDFCNEFLPQFTNDPSFISYCISLNSNIFNIIVEIKTNKSQKVERIIGYFAVFPLTAEGNKQLLKNNWNIKSVDNEVIAKDGAFYDSIYLAMILARNDIKSKAKTLDVFEGYVTGLKSKNVRLLFTRPVTDDGFRLAQQKKLIPVKKNTESNMIYYRDLKSS